MSVSTQKDGFALHKREFDKMTDVIGGRAIIQDAGERYLPKPPSLVPAKDPSGVKYKFYKSFAEFPEQTTIFLNGLLGMIHKKAPTITLPKRMEYLLESATPDGKSLVKLWFDLTREVLLYGRHGLLPEVGKEEAYLCQYPATQIINWRAEKITSGVSASLIVLHEPRKEAQTDVFTENEVNYYRVLRMEDGTYIQEEYREGSKLSEEQQTGQATPGFQGRRFDKIPFVMVNAVDLELNIGPIPLGPVADKCLDIYRKTATYNRALYMKGDPNIIRTGVTQEEHNNNTDVGGAIWDFENSEATVSYLDLDGSAIPYQREAIMDDFRAIEAAAGRLLDSDGNAKESGDALRERAASKQVTTQAIVKNAAEGMETALQNIAVVMGLKPEEVVFKPNMDFAIPGMTGKDASDLMDAMMKGAPLSRRSAHERMRAGGLTSMSYEDELEEIGEEGDFGLGDDQ